MIPFNRPYTGANAARYLAEALASDHRHGDGRFTRQCHEWLERTIGCGRALLTTSCSAALEMAAILAEIGPGDEVIMPSFTFPSTANAFVLRGATPVFVDIDARTQNIAPDRIAAAVTRRTKAIVPVHYAGIACDMPAILEIARHRELVVIEDAAQALLSRQDGRYLGTAGHLAALSFHDSKNTPAGEAGALLINDSRFFTRAEIIREKGTNRSAFLRGSVDKYTWIDVGSSFLPSEVTAALLLAQLEEALEATAARQSLWKRYIAVLEGIPADLARVPVVPTGCEANGHIFYLVLQDADRRQVFIEAMRERGIVTLFHYVPLHDSPAGRRFARFHGELPVTEATGRGLVRLPLWRGMSEAMVDAVVAAAVEVLRTEVAAVRSR